MKSNHKRNRQSLLKRFIAVFFSILFVLPFNFIDAENIFGAGADLSSTSSLGDVVHGLNSGLYNDSSNRVQDNDIIYSTDSLKLYYGFSMTESQIDAVRSTLEAHSDYSVQVAIPTGLKILESSDIPVYSSGQDKQFATLVFDSSGNGVSLRFEGSFWEGGTSIDAADIYMSCQLDIGDAATYQIDFADSTNVSIQNGDALKVDSGQNVVDGTKDDASGGLPNAPFNQRVTKDMVPSTSDGTKTLNDTTDMPSVFGDSLESVNSTDLLLQDVVEDLVCTLRRAEDVLGDNATVYSTEALVLFYEFNIPLDKVLLIKSALVDGHSEYNIYVEIPDGLKSTSKGKTVIYVDGTTSFASLDFMPDGRGFFLRFDGDYWKDVETVPIVDAKIYVSCQLDMDEIGTDTSRTIILEGNNSVTITIGDPKTLPKVEKEGIYKDQKFTWTITYTPGTGSVEAPITIVDTFSNEFQEYVTGSLKKDNVKVVSDFQIIPNATENTTTIEYILKDPLPTETVKFTYETALTSKAFDRDNYEIDTTVYNQVVLKNEEIPNGWSITTGTAIAPKNEKNMITKTVNSNSFSTNGQITWTVTFSPGDLALENLKLHDLIPAGLILNKDDIKVNNQSIDAIGAQFNIEAPDVDGNTEYVITFAKPYAPTYTVTYVTTLTDELLKQINTKHDFNNKAWLTFNWKDGPPISPSPEASVGVGVRNHIITKSSTKYDRDTHIITWKVIVNPSKLDIKVATLTDNLKRYANTMTYVPYSFTTTDTRIDPPSYNELEQILTFNVGNIGRNSPTITFQTYVDAEDYYAFNSSSSYKNTIDFDGIIDFNGVETPIKDDASYTISVPSNVVTKTAVSNSSNTSVYDYNNNKIKWRIMVNENKMPMEKASLVDTLPSYLSFVENSVRIGTSANSIEGILSDYDTRVLYDNNTLTINLDGLVNGITKYITFETTVDTNANPAFINSSLIIIDNTIILKRPDYNDTSSSTSVKIDNKTINKGVAGQDGNKISYSIDINGNSMNLANCKLTDTLPPGMKLDLDSVQLWKTNVSESGIITATTDPAPKEIWEWEYNVDDNSFTISLPKSNDCYVLTYDCYATMAGSYTNNVILEGKEYSNNVNTDKEIIYIAGGSASTRFLGKGNLTITKRDSRPPYTTLAGVTFTLWTTLNGFDTIVDEGTTDSSGKLTFQYLNTSRTYWLVETTGISGYDKASAIVHDNGTVPLGEYKFTLGDNDDKMITIDNERSNTQSTDVTLYAKKDLSGQALSNNMFSFIVKDEKNNIVSTGTNRASGTISFSPIHFTVAGTYNYTISEVKNNANGVTYDSSIHNVQIVVVESDGILNAKVAYTDGDIVFYNTYIAEDVSINLKGTKDLISETGEILREDMFSFIVREGTDIVATGTNTIKGDINFGAIHYTEKEIGTHVYTVSELKGSAWEITYDDTNFTVTVEVAKDSNENLTATVDDSNSQEIVFINTYAADSADVLFTGTKSLTRGSLLEDNMFSFIVEDNAGNIVSTGTNLSSGSIAFSAIHHTEEGTYTYNISEVKGQSDLTGITYDTETYEVKVVVARDTVDGKLYALEQDDNPTITFTNEINSSADIIPIKLQASKDLDGKALGNYMFSFIVEDEENNIVSTGTNRAPNGTEPSGIIDFGYIYYDDIGKHAYRISEVTGNESGITYDATPFDVEVKVSRDGDDALVADIIYVDNPEERIVFTNTYVDNSGDVKLTGRKHLSGKSLTDHMFSFIVEDAAGDIVTVGTNKSDGIISFPAIQYTTPGIYNYTVSEVIGSASGINYDRNKFAVTVKVSDPDGNGKLVTAVTYHDGPIDFKNTYIHKSSDIQLTGTKLLTGKDLEDNKFSFIIEDTDGNVLSVGTNRADGTINFGSIYFSETGTYTCKVSEINSSSTGITYDPTVHTLNIEVIETEDGSLEVVPLDDSLLFTNEYVTQTTDATLTGSKTLTGRDLEDDMFRFTVEDADGKEVATGINKADGTIDFTPIPYKLSGTYNYKVSEVKENTSGYTYDETVYNVTVSVVNKSGILSAMVTYPDGDIKFNNTYTGPNVGVTLAGTKFLTGKDLTKNMFTFLVKDAKGKTVVTGKNKANGKIIFDTIQYTAAGTYKYKVSEEKGTTTGITYDKTVYNVTVKVVEKDGKLTATTTYPDSGLVFKNSYSTSGATGDSNNNSKLLTRLKTGDTSRIYFWLIVCLASAALISTLLWLKHKKRIF